MACAEESERESMLDLVKEISNLTTISPGHPYQMKHYLIARRKMLWSGYELAKFQKTVPKSFSDAQTTITGNERRKVITKRDIFSSTKNFQKIMKGLSERKQHLAPGESLDGIKHDEQSYRDRHEQYITKMKDSNRIQESTTGGKR